MDLPPAPPPAMRILDANLNRLGEGLRLLEDIARFSLNSLPLSQRLKDLRHEAGKISSGLGAALLSARDSQGDVGAGGKEDDRASRENLLSLVRANARRSEESLRTLEELASLPELSAALDRARLQGMRFELYSLEKELALSLVRSEKLHQMQGLYVVVDLDFLEGRDPAEATRRAIRGGASVIQLRGKGRDKGELLAKALAMRQACSEAGRLFIVNDHLDIALASRADGLHVGQGDLPVSVVRRHLPLDSMIGCSTHSLSQALEAEREGADYIALGSIYPTQTKTGAVVVGLDTLRRVRETVSLPVVAIGGIKAENAAAALEAGADGLAVISAVLGAEDMAAAASALVAIIEKERKR